MHSLLHFLWLKKIFLAAFLFNCVGCSKINNEQYEQQPFTKDPLKVLMEGNMRFAEMKPVHPDEDVYRLRSVTREQHPFAVIVSCSDSRVSPELIFDQGIGDLFTIRTAGNIIGNVGLGSIEYAVEHLQVKFILILGHERCGAVDAFVQGDNAPGHIRDIIDSLKAEMEIKAIPYKNPNRLDDCVKANVEHGIRQLTTQSEMIREKIQRNELRIVGGRYDLDNLKVELIHQ
ncbi:MAG TPA: carbonic anhydrase [Sediminibacterium sp.]|nr:carbonic anhydrase [Sediminibacterium sp.]